MKKTLLLTVALGAMILANAKPASPRPVVRTQANGTQVITYLHGDEHFHWTTNAKGDWLQLAEDGNYQTVAALTDEQIQAKRQIAPRYIAQSKQVGEVNLAPKGLIILVNYKDVSFKTSKAEIDSMHKGYNYTRNYSYTYEGEKYTYKSSGSARQYFYDQSFGTYNPQFTIVGPYTLSNNMEYYGANDAQGNDKRPEYMIKEACQLANDDVDFSEFDNDNDGEVDFVYVIYAGYQEADGGDENTIWPHSWELKDAAGISLKLDNKYINLYACGSELGFYSKQHDGIGTFCHEFSHVLGLPDLYDTNYSHGKKTPGTWDIMDSGSYNNDGNTPPAYSGYERFFMGWASPRLLNAAENVKLSPLATSKEVLIVTSTGKHNLDGVNPNPTTFWVLANHQQTSWDEFLPGHGLVITKIQYSSSKWSNNTVNNTGSKLGIQIVAADGKEPEWDDTEGADNTDFYGKATDAFPAGATTYTKITNYPITEIAESGDIITFKFMGGKDDTAVEMVTTDVNYYVANDKLYIEGLDAESTICLYDCTGRCLVNKQACDNTVIELPNTQSVYLFTIDNGKQTQSYKIVK